MRCAAAMLAVVAPLLLVLTAAPSVLAAPKNVDLTTLILTVPGWTEYDHAETILRAYGAPYEVRAIQASEYDTLNVTSLLTKPNGSGKYGFLIVTPANVINIFGGVLSLNQVNQVYAYQEAFGVRLVLEGPYVPTVGSDIAGGPQGLGIAQVSDSNPATSVATATVAPTAPLTTSGIKANAPLDLTGLYATPATITNTSRSTPALNIASPSSFAGGYAAVTTKFDTGREQFTTFFPCAAWSSDCLLTAHLYYAWGMHGILPGARDALFSVQIDDLFLFTEEPFNDTVTYRMTVADARALATFSANVPGLPPGSSFRPEFWYNNGGYISQTQPDLFFATWDDYAPPDTLQTFQKPPGTGWTLMPSKPNISWWNPTIWKQDPLYNEMAFGSSGMVFFMGHHTFVHENMNNCSYNDAYQAIRLNQAAAAPWNTTNGKFNRFSQTAMVTPAISGLRNVDALQALLDTGITAGAGDTSWPHLRNQANPWQAQVTSVAANQTVDGFYIIPRSPTEVYYDVSTEAVEAQLYNWLYCCNSTANPSCPTNACEAGKPFTQPSAWSDILAREQVRVLRLLLALRPDGHMFHQANTRIDAGPSNKSLLQQWVTAILNSYSSKVTWPLQSLKLDDQLAFAKKRIQRDSCGLSYTLTYDDVTKAATNLTVTAGTSGSGCDAPLMVNTAAVTGANPNPRVMGSEPRLYSVTLAPGQTKTLGLGTTLKWS